MRSSGQLDYQQIVCPQNNVRKDPYSTCSRHVKALKDFLPAYSLDQDTFLAGCCTRLDLDPGWRNTQLFSNKSNDRPVCLPVNGRGGDATPDGPSPFVISRR